VLIRPRKQIEADIRERITEGKRLERGIVSTLSQMDGLEEKESNWSEINHELLVRSFSGGFIAKGYLDIQFNRYYDTLSGRINAFNEKCTRKFPFWRQPLRK
jgi:hypothetical protein